MDQGGAQTEARRAELVLHEIESLPTLPGVAARLMKVASADDADLREIMRLIESDPTLTARVLSLCRRAELGLGSRVTTVERAVVLLGLEAVQSIVLSVQVIDWAREAERSREKRRAASAPDGAFDWEGFWRHSIATACCADLLARKHKHLNVQPGEAFVGGLMHDLGKLALRLVLPTAYGTIVELSLRRQANIADVEREVIGLDHHTAGKRLAERWELPEVYQDVMWLHGQDPRSVPRDRHAGLVGLINTADAMCRGIHLGWSGNHVPPMAIDELCRPLKLELDRVEGVLPVLVEMVSQRCMDLGVSEEPSEALVVESLKSANRQLARLGETLARRARIVEDQARVIEALAAFHAGVENESGVREVLEAVTSSAQTALGGGPVIAVHLGGTGEAWLVVERAGPKLRATCSIVEGGGGRTASLDEAAVAARVSAIATLPGRGVLRMPVGAGPARAEEPQTLVFHANREEADRLGVKLLGPLLSGWQGVLVAARRYETARRTSEQLAESNRVLAQTRAELTRAQSMARLGELTAGAAHEMNTPLTVISGRGQMLVASLPDPKQKAAAQAVIGAAQRLAELITRLHTIACPPEAKPGPVSVPDLVSDAVQRAQARTLKRRANAPVIPIRVKYGELHSMAKVDRELITQALTELLVNAIESGPRDFVEVRVHAAPADDRLLVEVRDTGCGMSEHALAHAFDPFFSEKPAGRQPGLGLSLALRFVERHKGTIVLRSVKDEGTTARIELPGWRWQETVARAAA